MQSALVDSGKRRVVLAALLALVFLAVLAATARPAAAYSSYKHKTATSCINCHSTGDTNVPPVDADCTASGCHTGGFVARQTAGASTRTCWTCHDPGQDMSSAQGAGCGAAAAGCHTGTPHFGANMQNCTTACHGVVQSGSNPGTSAHHNNTVYTAPTCTTSACHGATPHEAYLGAGTCTTCHAGMGATHPAVAAMVAPNLTFAATPAIVKYGLTTILSGALKNGTTAMPGVKVTLQSKPVGTAAFAYVAEATTAADGTYTFAALSSTMLTSYRVVTPGGLVNTTVVRPGLKSLDVKVKPSLTIALGKTSFLLGGKELIKGTLNPARTGGTIKLTIQRKVSGVWKTQLTKSVALLAGSGYTTYSYSYKPLKRGSYRVKANVAATTELAATFTAYKSWVVK